jgi:hypothetical protein
MQGFPSFSLTLVPTSGNQRVFDAADEANSLRMETTGELHIGHMINVFRQGLVVLSSCISS